jgi:deoxyribodipyrimidine photolyase-related protein
MDASVLMLFPNQLFHQDFLIKDVSTIFLLEKPHFFSRFAFHKQKILLHRASMKAYEKSLQDDDYTVVYRNHELCKIGFYIIEIFF